MQSQPLEHPIRSFPPRFDRLLLLGSGIVTFRNVPFGDQRYAVKAQDVLTARNQTLVIVCAMRGATIGNDQIMALKMWNDSDSRDSSGTSVQRSIAMLFEPQQQLSAQRAEGWSLPNRDQLLGTERRPPLGLVSSAMRGAASG